MPDSPIPGSPGAEPAPVSPAPGRHPLSPPAGTALALGAAGLVLAILAGLVALYWPALDRAVAYEDSPITWLSTSVLIAAALVAAVLAEDGAGRRWGVLALLLALAALDERFMGHEQLRDWLLQASGSALSREDWRANLGMLLYPLAGGSVAWRCVAGLPRGGARALAGLALLLGSAAVLLDISTVALGWQVIEELLELLAELAFLCALLLARAYWSSQSRNTLTGSRMPASS